MAPLYSLFNLYFCPRAWRILRLLPFPSLCAHGAFIFPIQSIFLSPGLEDPPAPPFPFALCPWRLYIPYSIYISVPGPGGSSGSSLSLRSVPMAPLYSLFNLYFCPRAWRILRLLPFPSLCAHGAFIFPIQSIFLSPGLEDPPAPPFPFALYPWRLYIPYSIYISVPGPGGSSGSSLSLRSVPMAPLYSLFNLYFCPRAWRILRFLPFPSLCAHGAFVFPVQSIFLSLDLEDLPASFFIHLWRIYISYRNHVAFSGFIFPRPLPFPFRVYVTVSPGPIRILPLRKKVTDVAGFIKAFPLRGRSPRSVG